MQNPQLSLCNRIIIRLTSDPEILDMSAFSVLTPSRATFCLAGLILLESHVLFEYDVEGFAIGLKAGTVPPSRPWKRFEGSIVQRNLLTDPEWNVTPSAREHWAREYGIASAKRLPFYIWDWPGKRDLRTITASEIIDRLREIC